MKKLFLDIETLPCDGPALPLLKQLYDESKKTRRKLEPVSFDDYVRGTSLQGEFGRIFCIGFAVNDQQTECLSGDEKEILKKFWEIAKDADLFIGHNVMDFDFRFIYKRSVILGIKPSRDLPFARYRSEPIFDTMKEWEKWGSQGVSLHRLSLALGLESSKSDGIDGSQVYDFFLQNRQNEIIEYCKRDVEVTRKIYNRIKFIESGAK